MRTNEKDQRLTWGYRKSDKLVRAYKKKEVAAYRVELELHSRLLRREQILTLDDFDDLPEVVYPAHFQFVNVDWKRLRQHIMSKLGPGGKNVLNGADKRARSLSRLRRYLRRNGIVNVHRFLVPLALNREITQALGRWARDFEQAKYGKKKTE
ncbi:MAG TPA: hypothetical protein VFA90_01915 [Terriglobales bacterium]|nr:hypothetical protein [Terriglobales bacterium]